MALNDDKLYFCKKCNRTMRGTEFYTSNNLEKFPNDGKLDQCKKCVTMHVDNYNPDTYLWIIQDIDVPWVPDEWNKLLAKYGQDKSKLTGMTILGRYLSKMKLKQYKDYRWKDTEHLREVANSKIETTMKQSGYSAAEIAEVIEKATFKIPDGELVEPPHPEPQQPFYVEDYLSPQEEEIDDLDLTDDDKIYLRLKWGKAYKPEEWVRLEQLYNEMMESYDIQSAGHIDTLKLLCKTSLKANQLIDIGDVEGFQKMSKVYDQLMKSGKFTAAQNKAEQGEFVDSISELVTLCEKEGFIPRYYTDGPMDRVDETLEDMKHYTHSLVTEEMNLGNLIENAVKQMAREEAKPSEEDSDDEEITLESLSKEVVPLSDEDYEEYNDFLEDQIEEDNKLLDLLSTGEITHGIK